MFGHKDGTWMDALMHFRTQGRVHKPRIRGTAIDAGAKTPTDVLVRKETYFAMSRRSRWNQ